MTKELNFLLAGLAFALGAHAEQLTPDDALSRAVSARSVATRAVDPEGIRLVYTQSTKGMPSVYVFQNPDNRGYLLVSADDVAVPLLGYADSGCFREEEMPPQLKWWIGEYGRQIRYAAERNLTCAMPKTRAGREAVSPLLKTAWNQGTPYDMLTPEIKGQHTPTGCVATAMAQVMKYWNYPDVGQGSATITLPDSTKDVMRFRDVPFEWDKMLDRYAGTDYTEAQAGAVARLMKACGYASGMSYALGGSGAMAIAAAYALIDNFKYSSNIQYYSRNFLSAGEWDDIVYNEIANRRPVMYGGQSTSVGHEFVCDGYDGKGYYHFNWGWGGMSDGYFLLDALNPDAVGTGGGAGGGFNYGQDIIVGVQPDKGDPFQPPITQLGMLTGTVVGKIIKLTCSENGGWFNTGLNKVTVDMAVKVESYDTRAADPVYVSLGDNIQLEGPTPPDYRMQGKIGNVSVALPSGLSDGRYRLTICYRSSTPENSPWLPVQTASYAYNYIDVIKSGSALTVENPGEALMTLTDMDLISPLYFGSSCRFRISVANNSAKELTQSFCPALLLNGQEQMTAEGITITLQPGEKVTREFTTAFDLSEGAKAPEAATVYDLMFYDYNLDYYYDPVKEVTMQPESATAEVTVTDLKIPGKNVFELALSVKEASVKGYYVSDRNNIEFSASVNCTQGFYGMPVYLVIFPEDIYVGNARNVAMVSMGPTPVLSEGESAELSATLDFGNAGTQVYTAIPYIVENGDLVQVKNSYCAFKVTDNSGVDSAISDGTGIAVIYDNSSRHLRVEGAVNAEVYSLDGRSVSRVAGASGIADVDLSALSIGIYIVKAEGPDGHSKTVKIAVE